MTRGASLLVLLVALAAVPTLGQEGDSRNRYEVWYRVSARHRRLASSADLEAGGRLLMAAQRVGSSEMRLELVRILEDPWKLFAVDAFGPFGGETKYASVVTLPEASWAALDAARRRSAAAGRARHAAWLASTDRPRDLDGTFAFVVVGNPRHRFNLAVGNGGAVSEVTNRLTHHWLPGPFDQFIGAWGNEPRARLDADGYWFWNHGENEPFDYEPHTYHAFAVALELLGSPLPSFPDAEASWAESLRLADEVLATLAPKGRDRFAEAQRPSPGPSAVVARTHADGTLHLSTALSTPTEHAELETVFSSRGRPLRHRAEVRLESSRGGFLEVEAGYRVQDLAEDTE